jgi:hypothetical protein
MFEPIQLFVVAHPDFPYTNMQITSHLLTWIIRGERQQRVVWVQMHAPISPTQMHITYLLESYLLSLAFWGAEVLYPSYPLFLFLSLSPPPLLPTYHLSPLLPIAKMSDKNNMMKLNNKNYKIWKILMGTMLVHKQLHDVAWSQHPWWRSYPCPHQWTPPCIQ